ncbi:MAG TPA: 3-hydroxyacyl-ACP dehydratase [Cytophagales bacterium]|jgi:3-hydroxyacyl-[acyl-carrier-protein] dehydratase|nr:3-hydroxyacyl-ACP dehydratase [Cytophagales bacterium]
MLVSKNDITSYIPQQSPFVMIDQLIEADINHAKSEFTIESKNPLLEDHFFSESGMIENMAQTAAAQVGYFAKKQNIPVPIGYIASVKDIRIFNRPKVGDTLTTIIRVTNQVMDVTLCAGEVWLRNELLCTCELRIFIKK